MATGIVSMAAADHGYHVINDVLVVLAAVGLAVLVAVAVFAWCREPLDLKEPDVPIQLLTFVAACAVVGTRLNWSQTVHWSLAVVAFSSWLFLLPLAFRAMLRYRWTGLRDRARGGGELISVATSGLAILAADLGMTNLAIALLVFAICLYLLMTGLVIWRVCHDPSAPELFQPDIWILMGGAAIATLAGDHIHKAGVDAIKPVTVVTWMVASAWIPLLIVVSTRLRPGNWWAAVFPLGMYSSATFATAAETGWRTLTTVSLVFFWIALTAWIIAAVESLLRFRRSRARDAPSGPAR